MGLDACCNNVSIKCGSYGSIAKLHTGLLIGLKDYLEMESDLEDQEKDVMIDILVRMLANEAYHELNYSQLKMQFWRYKLDGFFPLIAIEDQGSMTAYEAKRLMKTVKIIRESLDRNTLRGILDLQPVLKESIHSGDNVHFS
jgi:hypothetical protein